MTWSFSSYWTKQKQGCLIGPFQLPTQAVKKEITDNILFSQKKLCQNEWIFQEITV